MAFTDEQIEQMEEMQQDIIDTLYDLRRMYGIDTDEAIAKVRRLPIPEKED